jgi:hypothetical protein
VVDGAERLRRVDPGHRLSPPEYDNAFGDSGGPIFVSGTTTLVAVVSFRTGSTCSGTSGAYRIDQADDLAFLDTFGVTPP